MRLERPMRMSKQPTKDASRKSTAWGFSLLRGGGFISQDPSRQGDRVGAAAASMPISALPIPSPN